MGYAVKPIPKTLQSKWSLKEPPYIKKVDKRYKRYKGQLKRNGFCDAETWGLDSVIAEFVLPRLKWFKELNIGYPGNLTYDTWNEIIDKMIFAFEWSLNSEEDKYKDLKKEEQEANWEKYKEGMQLFATYFRDLWW